MESIKERSITPSVPKIRKLGLKAAVAFSLLTTACADRLPDESESTRLPSSQAVLASPTTVREQITVPADPCTSNEAVFKKAGCNDLINQALDQFSAPWQEGEVTPATHSIVLINFAILCSSGARQSATAETVAFVRQIAEATVPPTEGSHFANCLDAAGNYVAKRNGLPQCENKLDVKGTGDPAATIGATVVQGNAVVIAAQDLRLLNAASPSEFRNKVAAQCNSVR